MKNRAFHPSQRSHRRRQQRGAAMLFAIVLIVVASLLGTAMVRMLRVEQVGVARDVISTRSLLAADSGAQRAMFQLFDGTLTSTARADRCKNTIEGSSTNFTVTGLAGCRATIKCTPYAVPATPASTSNYYSIVASATCGPSNDPAARRVEVLARDI